MKNVLHVGVGGEGGGVGAGSIPGMGGDDRAAKKDFKLSIPGLDVQVRIEGLRNSCKRLNAQNI